MDASPPTDAKPTLAPTLAALAAAVVLGLLGAAGVRRVWLKPQWDASDRRFETSRDLMTLYSLQLDHKAAKGVFAGDLDSLLALSPEGAALKARLAAHVDMNTLAVVGDAERFKLEANVLDPERTLIKVRGPILESAAGPAPAADAASASGLNEGAPIAPER